MDKNENVTEVEVYALKTWFYMMKPDHATKYLEKIISQDEHLSIYTNRNLSIYINDLYMLGFDGLIGIMKNMFSSITSKILLRYKFEDESLKNAKSTNINILLNRVKLDQKKESRKKLLFMAATSLGAVLFGVLVF